MKTFRVDACDAAPRARFKRTLLAWPAAILLLTGCPRAGTTPPAGTTPADGTTLPSDMTPADDMMPQDGTPTTGGGETLPASAVTRLPFTTQCGQFAGLCTSSFPTPVLNIDSRTGQNVTSTSDPFGFIVQGSDGDGSEIVIFKGGASRPGATATEITYSWTSGATDDNPCTLEPGPEFSTDPDVEIAMQAGLHYIRLTVTNDLPLLQDQLPQNVIDTCGTLAQSFKFDSIEVLVDVRD